jgi:hypothetical protein
MQESRAEKCRNGKTGHSETVGVRDFSSVIWPNPARLPEIPKQNGNFARQRPQLGVFVQSALNTLEATFRIRRGIAWSVWAWRLT